MIWAAPLMLAAALAARDPDGRQALADLAYALGQAHALRQVCGSGDQGWRTRMSQMLELEASEIALRRRLSDAFNAGFMAEQVAYPTCGPETRAAERAVAQRGNALAQRLGKGPQ